jgi:hypothetical protein
MNAGNALGCAVRKIALGVSALLCLSGCATTTSRPGALVEATRLDASRFVVIAVPNEVAPTRLHLGPAFEYGNQQGGERRRAPHAARAGLTTCNTRSRGPLAAGTCNARCLRCRREPR